MSPVYTYYCNVCQAQKDEWFPRAVDPGEEDDPVVCACPAGATGEKMVRIPSAVGAIHGGGTPVFYPNRGKQ